MGFWNSKTVTEVHKPIEIDGSIFNIIGQGPSYAFGSYDNTYRILSFTCIPEVNAIFNLRARAAGNMRVVAVDAKTGLELPDIEDETISLIEQPNYFQSKEELFGQTTLFKDIFGDEFMYIPKPVGMSKPIGLFTLPPQAVVIKPSPTIQHHGPFYMNKQFPQSSVYTFKDFDGKEYLLNQDGLLHLNDNNIRFNNEQDFFRGTSKLDALRPAIENLRAAYEARNVLIVNRGAIGILSNAARDGIGGVAPMNAKEKEIVQREFSKYGLTKDKWQVIITNLALSWQQMAIDVDKLRLFEETREDTLKICDSYGTPYEMLSSIRNTTFDNKKEAQRQWYRDTIIPEANMRIAGINRKFDTVSRGYRLVPKFDHLPIFETERKERAQSLMLTVNALTKALEDSAITIDQYQLELKKFGI